MKTVYTCYPGGKHKALSLSYDDGKTADRRLVELLNSHDIKGTFHLNSGLLGKDDTISAKEAASLYKGHEISAHSFSHPTIARCPKEQIALQILEDRKRLEDITGYTVRGFSYPNGSWSREMVSMLPHLGIKYARLVDTTNHFYMSDDYLTLKTTCHHNDYLLTKAEEFAGLSKTQHLFWFTVWGHSWEFNVNDNWELIEKFCSITGGRDDTWFTTFIGMIDYMDAAKQLSVSVSGNFAENPSAQSVWISVDGKIFEVSGGGKILFDRELGINPS